MAENPDHAGHHRHSEEGEQPGFEHHRFYRIPPCGETTIEHDEDEGCFATALGQVVANIGEGHDSVIAEQEPQDKDCQQGWSAEFG